MPHSVLRILIFPFAFIAGGLLCLIAQALIIRTKLSVARILIIFLLAGIVLETVGAFSYMKAYFGAGVTIPILGFGAALANGAIGATSRYGIFGAFSGGLMATALGVSICIIASFLVSLIFKPKVK